MNVATANDKGGAGVEEDDDDADVVFVFVAFAFVVISSSGASTSATAASELAASELTMLLLLSLEETEGEGCSFCGFGCGSCRDRRLFVILFLSFEVSTSLLSSESLLGVLLLKEMEDAGRCAMVNSNYQGRNDNKLANKSIDVNEINILI